LACELAELAVDASPHDTDILKIHSNIYRARAEHPLTTSLMAKGIFNAASKDRIKGQNMELESSPSLWQKVLSYFGFLSLPSRFY
jgi:hypothetical protein